MEKKAEKIYEKVKAYVLDEDTRGIFTKENMAEKFKTKPHVIDQCFTRLNLEGHLSQPEHRKGDDRWYPDIYRLTSQSQKWFSALKQRDIEKIEKFLKEGQDIHEDNWKDNALTISANTSKLSYVKYILDLGFDPTYGDELETLKNIFLKQNKAIALLVLSYMDNLFLKDEEGETIFFFCVKNFSGILKELIDMDFDINEKNSKRDTPLIAAVRANNIDSVAFLLENGAKVSSLNRYNKSAFTYAFEKNDMEMLKLFYQHRDKLSRKDKQLFKKVRLRLIH